MGNGHILERALAYEDDLLLTPHGERSPRCRALRASKAPSPNPSWGTVTRSVQGVKRHAIGTPDRHRKGTPHRRWDRLVPVANRRVPDQVLFVLVAYRLLAPGSEWRL